MPYSGQIIDSPLVTSLHDKKGRGKRRHQSIQLLSCGAQRRGDALPNSKQQGPRCDTWVRLSPLKPASKLDFCLGELCCFEDVQPRCFILRSVLPTRARFLVDIFFFFFCIFFRADQEVTRIAADENMCERRSVKGMGCLWSPKETQRGLNTN